MIQDLLFNGEVLRQGWDIFVKRGLPMLGGVALVIIGIAFVLSGSKAGRLAGGIIETVATKGGNVVSKIGAAN